MLHQAIQINNLSLSFPHKLCFENFTTRIMAGSRIAIIGRNGVGKSTLLTLLQKTFPADVAVGYVPQVIEQFDSLSGGQRFQESLTQALSRQPHVLLLDEPTNHLDSQHRNSLLRMLQAYAGTLIIVSHDVELLRTCVDSLWHIDQGKINIFSGRYDDYRREIEIKQAALQQELAYLERQQKVMHQALMKEQQRAKKSNLRGEKSIRERKWPTIVSDEKARRAITTSGKKKKIIQQERDIIVNELSQLYVPEVIVPKFALTAADVGHQLLVSIRQGTIAYSKQVILENINFSLFSKERLAICGNNGSGKSTLVKAIYQDPQIIRQGDWQLPHVREMAYLDQHYCNLIATKTVIETISESVNSWSYADIRRHLNDFLFRKNEEVNQCVNQLSGGEKVRLSLAVIAAQTPRLLILDEVTNNLDLETREHVIQILREYPAAMIVISHDEDFLQRILIEQSLKLSS